uniref:Transmembrane 9 superfamily member n=1 Tax=Eptatretus burgeri TaxID=7764 RepID=A0A8C4R591_EPTBU
MATCVRVVLLGLLTVGIPSSSSEHFKVGDPVPVYVNKVGPYHNPHETYHYYSLPVCRPQSIEHKRLSLGEVLDGDRMALSTYEVKFGQDEESKVLCELSLERRDLDHLRRAVEELYYYEFVMDDIPLRGFVGYLEETGFLPHSHKLGLWTHLHFTIEYNDNQIVFANVSTKDSKPLSLDDVSGKLLVKHFYSVKWYLSPLPYEKRGERLRDKAFFPKTLEIHWLSVINSIVLVFLLTGFVVIILMRVLKNDFAKIQSGRRGDRRF